MMTVVGLVLLIACVNVTNMLLARAVDRRKEFGIRLAMGSSRRRLIRQLLTESLLLAMVGGSVGLVVATWTAEALRPSLPFGAGQFDPGLDGRVVGFVVTVVLGRPSSSGWHQPYGPQRRISCGSSRTPRAPGAARDPACAACWSPPRSPSRWCC